MGLLWGCRGHPDALLLPTGVAETTINNPASCSLLETIVNPVASSSDSDNTSTIVGIVVGVVLGVLFCAGFWYWCTRPRPANKGLDHGGTYVGTPVSSFRCSQCCSLCWWGRLRAQRRRGAGASNWCPGLTQGHRSVACGRLSCLDVHPLWQPWICHRTGKLTTTMRATCTITTRPLSSPCGKFPRPNEVLVLSVDCCVKQSYKIHFCRLSARVVAARVSCQNASTRIINISIVNVNVSSNGSFSRQPHNQREVYWTTSASLGTTCWVM